MMRWSIWVADGMPPGCHMHIPCRFMNIFISTWVLLVAGLVFALPMIHMRVKETTEESDEILCVCIPCSIFSRFVSLPRFALGSICGPASIRLQIPRFPAFGLKRRELAWFSVQAAILSLSLSLPSFPGVSHS